MKYHQAVALREEVLCNCNDLAKGAIKIAKQKTKNQPLSYQLHIINSSFENRLRLQTIAEKNHLAFKDQYGIIVIYKP